MKFSTFTKKTQLIKARLANLSAQVNSLSDAETLSSAQRAKVQSIQELASSKNLEFDSLTDKLYETDPLPDDLKDDEVAQLQEEISDLYLNIVSSCTALTSSLDISSASQPSQPNSNLDSLSIRLPRLNLGTFNGDSSKWVAFHSLFESAVHNNISISAVEKFTYLLSCLQGEPLNIIKSLPLTPDNYQIAWDQLTKRYNNVRLLTSHHINNILDLPSMHKSSVKQLRSFLNDFQENADALQALKYDVCSESLFITTHMLRKFDHDFRSRFEQSRSDSQTVPTIKELLLFVEKQCIQLEAANLTQTPLKASTTTLSNVGRNQKPSFNYSSQNKVLLTAAKKPSLMPNCSHCDSADHIIYKCEEFLKLSPAERLNFARRNVLCTNCLRKHNVNSCNSQRFCNVCQKRHHSLLHLQPLQKTTLNVNSSSTLQNTQINKPSPVKHSEPLKPLNKETSESNTVMVGISHSGENTILLATALVRLQSNGHSIVVRAVLDSAAQHSFITESCAQRLNVSRRRQNNDISGISSSNVKTKGLCHLDISSLSGHELAKSHPVLILDKITNNLPQQQVSHQVKSRLRHLMLADPTFDVPSPVDALIGADLFAFALLNESLNLGEDMPSAMNTVFGYVLIGSSPVITKQCQFQNSTSLLTTTDFDLHSMIQKFWTQENVPYASKLSTSEQECETHFQSTHVRTNDGKYQVRLPLKDDPSCLGDSSRPALRQFQSLEQKLLRDPILREKYIDFMKDYEVSGHMVQCDLSDTSLTPHYFLPHHGVLRDDKLRVVFNASAVTSTGISLNNILHQGPKLHNNISDIILRFRNHRTVFVCDIKQMFRNIWIHEDDQALQLVFWRDDPNSELKIYKLKTVTYGMSSSPFLANRVIQQLLEDESSNFPTAAAALKDNIYVDDALLGCDSEDEAFKLQQDVIHLMQKGGFELRKWLSNSQNLLQAIPENYRGTPLLFSSEDQPLCTVLGLKWYPEADVFSYDVTISDQKLTKRSVLSVIARLYDPMGWLSPVIFWAKAFMQVLWTKCLQWDDHLPTDLSQTWIQFVKEVKLLQNIQVPRFVDTSRTCRIELHGFSDASETGFCACVYLRVVQDNGRLGAHLLIGKSRVAPLKRVSLPRLELCGAHLLVKLLNYCYEQYSKILTVDNICGWSDSTIVLSWIRTPSYRLKTYVANRVAEIQESPCPIKWCHVYSLCNPADCGSRGILPSQIIDHSLWWSGPSWLSSPNSSWPSSDIPTTTDPIPEMKPDLPTALHTSSDLSQSSLLSRFSTWTKLTHVIAYVLRFIRLCKTKVLRNKQNQESPVQLQEKSTTAVHLTLEEIDEATNHIVMLVQKEVFPSDLKALQKKQETSASLKRLSPFLDEKGLIRVGGRLSNSSLSFDAKHPILLPKQHHITNLIIDYYHCRYLHCGQQQLQSILSQKYWILSARRTIRSRIFHCIRCYRCRPTTNTPQMADLPRNRVTPTKAFINSAVDFAGPFIVKLHKVRRLQHIKVYLCLFICLSTKAVHLEVVMDLTSDAFIASLTRFISRRGVVSNLYSDNATNFVGAAHEITRIINNIIQNDPAQKFLTDNFIKFHFIPPRAPHFGGLWERAIQSVKKHLRRVIGDQTITLEEFMTLCCRVEAMLNSRPLTPLSSDPGELDVLTPGHFLSGGPLVTLPELDLSDVPTNRLRRWQLIQSFSQHIWRRWQKEYLHTLQHRPKWTKPQKNLEEGNLVLIHEDNSPPLQWKIGRVTKVILGRDKIVRVAEVKTQKGLITRPVTKLSILPMDFD